MNNNNLFASGFPTDNFDVSTIIRTAFNQLLLNVNTVLPAVITAVTGDNSYTIQPAINNLTTTGQPLTSLTLYNVPSMLIMGGVAGVIVDYQVNDYVLIGCCQRDITSSLAAQGAANPSTARKYDLRDAIIIGKIPITLPTINVHLKQDSIDINAPTVNVNADSVNLGNNADKPIILQGVGLTANIGGVQGGGGVGNVPITITAGGSTKIKGAQ